MIRQERHLCHLIGYSGRKLVEERQRLLYDCRHLFFHRTLHAPGTLFDLMIKAI